MNEQPYVCQGDLGKYATDLVQYVYETAPGEPDKFVVNGRSRKTGRKFGVSIAVGEEHELEPLAIRWLMKEEMR